VQLRIRHLPLELGEAPLDLVDQLFDHTLSVTRRRRNRRCRTVARKCCW
jgi:hypothetical protein